MEAVFCKGVVTKRVLRLQVVSSKLVSHCYSNHREAPPANL